MIDFSGNSAQTNYFKHYTNVQGSFTRAKKVVVNNYTKKRENTKILNTLENLESLETSN